ncbi:MAG: glycosyltransferase [Mycobacterium sp.]
MRHADLYKVSVVIPAYGRHDMVGALLSDLAAEKSHTAQVTVLDNRGDLTFESGPNFTVLKSPTNLRWIGSVNWAIGNAIAKGFDVVVVLNSDIRLSLRFVHEISLAAVINEGVAVAAPCYDDFWPHQHATATPACARDYRPVQAVRKVPFCDGTAIAFNVTAAADIGPLDNTNFNWHGYGADLDYSIRARRRGYRVIVTESCFVSHARRASMEDSGQSEQDAVAEVETGMAAKHGPGWRILLGLDEAALRTPSEPVQRSGWYLSPGDNSLEALRPSWSAGIRGD